MWTPYYLSSTTELNFNREQKKVVEQIQESIQNPYDWQGNKNEYFSSTPRQPQYKYPSEYFAAAQNQQRNHQRINNNYNSRLFSANINRERLSPYSPPQNYNQQNPNYKYEQWPQQGEQSRQQQSISMSSNTEQQRNQIEPPQPYKGNTQYNNNQQAQHGRQIWEKPPNGGSFSPYSNEG
uniref:Uncharacterized protein n=1 Tax=Panagrolaimus sp. ES5 TaxID=591445 RepID=A0AC34GRU2_9BILA